MSSHARPARPSKKPVGNDIVEGVVAFAAASPEPAWYHRPCRQQIDVVIPCDPCEACGIADFLPSTPGKCRCQQTVGHHLSHFYEYVGAGRLGDGKPLSAAPSEGGSTRSLPECAATGSQASHRELRSGPLASAAHSPGPRRISDRLMRCGTGDHVKNVTNALHCARRQGKKVTSVSASWWISRSPWRDMIAFRSTRRTSARGYFAAPPDGHRPRSSPVTALLIRPGVTNIRAYAR